MRKHTGIRSTAGFVPPSHLVDYSSLPIVRRDPSILDMARRLNVWLNIQANKLDDMILALITLIGRAVVHFVHNLNRGVEESPSSPARPVTAPLPLVGGSRSAPDRSGFGRDWLKV